MTLNPRRHVFDRPQALEQEELGSICFVRNYVELRFDGPIIRSLVGPIIRGTEAASASPRRVPGMPCASSSDELW